MKSYVFSRTMKQSLDKKVELVSENSSQLVRNLKNETGKDIYLCGGANLATIFFADRLIDEIILKVNPFLMGTGIPIFAGIITQTILELIDSKIYQNGTILLKYLVNY